MTRDQTDTAKGCAILLMLIHHAFGFPDRTPESLFPISILPQIHPEIHFAYFGKLCVAIFLFLSGFGLGASNSPLLFPSLTKRIITFLVTYWINITFLLGITWCSFGVGDRHFGSDSQSFPIDLKILIENFFLIRPSYSGEWWFARLYLTCILIVWPLCRLLARVHLWALPLAAISLLSVSPWVWSPDSILMWQASFSVGFIFSQRNHSAFNSVLEALAALPPRARLCSAILLGLSTFLISKRVYLFLDCLLAPIAILASISALSLLQPANRLFQFLGRHSFSMWLNHTFICYYWFPNAFYSLRYSPILLATLTATSLGLALIVHPLIRPLTRLAIGIVDRSGLTKRWS